MKVQVEYVEVDEVEVLVRGEIQDPQIQVVVQALSQLEGNKAKLEIAGTHEDAKYILPFKDILCFESNKDYLYALTKNGRYRIKSRLHEVEANTMGQGFMRISKWCLANIKQIEKIESGFNATMVIFFKESEITQVLTRSYVKAFKNRVLGE